MPTPPAGLDKNLRDMECRLATAEAKLATLEWCIRTDRGPTCPACLSPKSEGHDRECIFR